MHCALLAMSGSAHSAIVLDKVNRTKSMSHAVVLRKVRLHERILEWNLDDVRRNIFRLFSRERKTRQKSFDMKPQKCSICSSKLCKMKSFSQNSHDTTINSHWLGVPVTRSVVVSRTVMVTWRPDFGFPSAPSCGTAYTGLTLRALLNSSRRLSTDGRWICSTISWDRLWLAPFGAAFDWLTSTRWNELENRGDECQLWTHISSRRRCRSVHCSDPAAANLIHLGCHLLPSRCHCCTAPSAVLTCAAASWMSATPTSDECCCRCRWMMSCSRKSNRSVVVVLFGRKRKTRL